MSILDKASLIQIPSGYKSTKLYSIKPSNGDGDFTFARSSSATRVNSEGLIEVASVLGSEEVTNGDFSDGSTDWNLVGDFVVSGGSASITSASQYSQLTNQLGVNYLLSGKKYKLEFDIPTLSISNAFAYRYTGGFVTPISTSDIVNGKFTAEFTMTTNGYFWLQTTGSFTGLNVEVDNVSVKEVIENDVPRLDYSGGSSCASLLLEPQRTNLVTHSSDLDNAAWTKSGTTITANDATSPDGTINADKIIASSGLNIKIAYQVISSTNGVAHTVSAFYKADEYSYAFLRVGGQTPSPYVIYNLSNQSVVSTANATSTKIEDYGSGWYRVSMTYTANSATNAPNVSFLPTSGYTLDSSNQPSYNGDGSSGGYVYGVQLEANASYPTSYIPTSGSTVTRTADVCNNAGTSATFNSTEGVLFAEIAALANDSTQRFISLGDGTSNNRIILGYNNASNGIIFFIRVGGTLVANILTTINDIKNYNKLAVKWKENDFALWGNGVELGSDLSGVSFASGVLDNLNFLDADGTTEPFYGKVKQIQVYSTALTDSELQTLTTL